MPAEITVFVPIGMRSLTGGQRVVRASGRSVAEVIESLEAQYPGFHETLVEGERLRRGLTIAVNSVEQPLGLLAKVPEGAEVHILPAMAGGGWSSVCQDIESIERSDYRITEFAQRRPRDTGWIGAGTLRLGSGLEDEMSHAPQSR